VTLYPNSPEFTPHERACDGAVTISRIAYAHVTVACFISEISHELAPSNYLSGVFVTASVRQTPGCVWDRQVIQKLPPLTLAKYRHRAKRA
jgi:hypothetical protein